MIMFDFPLQAALSSATVVVVAAKSSERNRVLTKAKDNAIDNNTNSASPLFPDKLGTLQDQTAYNINNYGVRQSLFRAAEIHHPNPTKTTIRISNKKNVVRRTTTTAARNGEFDASKELGVLGNGSHEIKNFERESNHPEFLDCEMGRPLLEADVDFRYLVYYCLKDEKCPGGVSELGCWDTSQVTDMTGAFSSNSTFNEPIGSWDTSAVTDMQAMFWNARSFNQDLSSWDVSAVTNMPYMFWNARHFNHDLSSWDVSAVLDMDAMLSNARSFNQELCSWDVSAVTNMSSMFKNAKSFNQKLDSWDVSAVRTMSHLFKGAEAFNQDLILWDVSAVSDMSSMFRDATSFNQDLGLWNISEVTTVCGMFYGASSFDQDINALQAIYNATVCDCDISYPFMSSGRSLSPGLLISALVFEALVPIIAFFV